MPFLEMLFTGPFTTPSRGDLAIGGVIAMDESLTPISTMQFQYYPTSLSDSHPGEWGKKRYPGGSHPVSQFLGCNDRTISLEVKWYCEDLPTDLLFNKIPIDGLDKETEHSINIMARITYFRGLCLPRYDVAQDLMKSPPYLWLVLPNVLLDMRYQADTLPCFLTSADYDIQSMFRNGIPKLATQKLEFFERIQGPDVEGFGNMYHDSDTYTGNVEKFWTPVSVTA